MKTDNTSLEEQILKVIEHNTLEEHTQVELIMNLIQHTVHKAVIESKLQDLKDMQFRLKDALQPEADIRKIVRLRLALEAVDFRIKQLEEIK